MAKTKCKCKGCEFGRKLQEIVKKYKLSSDDEDFMLNEVFGTYENYEYESGRRQDLVAENKQLKAKNKRLEVEKRRLRSGLGILIQNWISVQKVSDKGYIEESDVILSHAKQALKGQKL